MNNMGDEFVTNVLDRIFLNVNNWINFAEAKNAALIAFNIAVISVLFDVGMFDKSQLFYITNIMLVISSGIALASFSPKMGKDNRASQSKNETDNLMFFADIAKYTKEEYLLKLYKKYLDVDKQSEDLSKIELDYADEITYNSKLAVKKYKKFKLALWVDLLVLLILIMLIIIA